MKLFTSLLIIFMAFNAKQGLLMGAGTKNLETVIHGILPQIIVLTISVCITFCMIKIMTERRVSVNGVIKLLLSSPFYLIIIVGFVMAAGASVKVLTAAVVIAAIIGLFAVVYLICGIIMFTETRNIRKIRLRDTLRQPEQDNK